MADTLRGGTAAVLLTADPAAKAEAARALRRAWLAGRLQQAPMDPAMPARPARPARPLLLAAAAMPKRGRAGSPATRFALLHALAHIELNAIDLATDMAGRWGPTMPSAFVDDWLGVAAEEACHFDLLAGLLAETGGSYGDLPAHDGLWEAAAATSADLAARLAVVPQVLEARGLDVTPAMIARFEVQGDHAAAAALQRILADEVGHVATGNRWFRHICHESSLEPRGYFRTLVRRHFRGSVKPPFNDSARHKAGLATDWYCDLGNADCASKP